MTTKNNTITTATSSSSTTTATPSSSTTTNDDLFAQKIDASNAEQTQSSTSDVFVANVEENADNKENINGSDFTDETSNNLNTLQLQNETTS